MANVLINPSIIAKEALFQLENNLVMGDKVHREYKNEFVKIGNTVTIRRPTQFVATAGATRVNQDVHEPTTSIVIDNRQHVSWTFSAQDLTLTIEEYSERYIKPAMITLANTVDLALTTLAAESFFNQVGTPGSTPADFGAIAAVAQRMDEMAIPDDMQRCLVLNPAARWTIADGLGAVFNAEITGDTIRRGRLGEIANFQIYGDQNIIAQQVGTYSGTPLAEIAPAITNPNTAGGGNVTSAIQIDGMTGTVTDALRKGDVLTFAGCNAVNPVSKVDTGRLAEWVVTANADTTAGVVVALVYPSFNDGTVSSTAAFQNCTALPLDTAVVTIKGSSGVSYPQNLAFHKNALALVMVPIELPDSAVFKARADWRGYSIRVVKAYDIDEDEEIIRLDILFGVRDIYPELGVRLVG